MFKISYSTSKDFFSKLETKYYILIALPMAIISVSFLKMYSERVISFHPELYGKIYIAVFLILMFAMFFIYFKYMAKIKEIRLEENLRLQLDKYAKEILKFNLFQQVLSLFASVCFAVTGDGFYGFCYIILLVFVSSMRPNIFAIRRTLKLKKEVHQLLLNQGELV